MTTLFIYGPMQNGWPCASRPDANRLGPKALSRRMLLQGGQGHEGAGGAGREKLCGAQQKGRGRKIEPMAFKRP